MKRKDQRRKEALGRIHNNAIRYEEECKKLEANIKKESALNDPQNLVGDLKESLTYTKKKLSIALQTMQNINGKLHSVND